MNKVHRTPQVADESAAKIRKDGLLKTNRGFEYSIYHTLCGK